ncbi:DUF3320 domain-containing protein [Phycisphaeraceae bacterium D3-23]
MSDHDPNPPQDDLPSARESNAGDAGPNTDADVESASHDDAETPTNLAAPEPEAVTQTETESLTQSSTALADEPEPPFPPGTLTLDIHFDKHINFAMCHNDVPAVNQIALTHHGDAPIREATVTLWIDRDLSDPWTQRIDRIEPGTTLHLDTIDLPLRADTLAHITERDSAQLHCSVTLEDHTLAEVRHSVDVLAFDEWAGIGSLPEILAAFVTPNHPVIGRLMGDARKHLELALGDRETAALSGYQRRDPAYARAIIDAVYRAAGDLNPGYITVPASFEDQGQRVRLPDQIAERKLGNCLDLSLLLAGMLEQAGLHPILVMTKGHAFVACHLHDASFPEPAVTEPLRLRKRIQLGEIVAIESTGLTHDPTMPLEQAEQAALRKLEDPDEYHYAIDIATARRRGIRPLPLRVKPGTYDLIDLERTPQAQGDSPPVSASPQSPTPDPETAGPRPGAEEVDETPALDLGIDLTQASAAQTRLDRWKRKLLDLSLRNRILNHRDTRKSIPLLCPDLAKLEDLLTDGEKFEIVPRSRLKKETDPRSDELHTERTGEDRVQTYLTAELKHGRTYADLADGELDKRLLEIYRAARLMFEESGANTLYLALGFLEWYESPSHTKPRLAPVLLVPVALERLSAQRGYRLSILDDEPRINVTLLEKLRTEYDLDVAGLDELTTDDAGLDVPKILRRFREVVVDIPRWDIVDRADLGLFSFTKFLMWRDLEDRSQALLTSKVVRHLVEKNGESLAGDTPLPDPKELDATRKVAETFCAKDADSSQLAAVFAAHDGQSFVLEGPPGTGKSQTITNLMAQMLAHGKRVLFVSEKMAALSVVHKRMTQIGLGPFCLELHSNKANKRQVLEQINEALEAAGALDPEGWEQQAEQLQTTRDGINALVAALHEAHPIGLSYYQATATLIGLRDVPALDLDLADVTGLEATTLKAMRDAADKLATAATATQRDQTGAGHPYHAAGVTAYHTALPDQLRALIDPASDAADALAIALTDMLKAFGLEASDTQNAQSLSADESQWLIGLGRLLTEPPRPSEALLRAADWTTLKPVLNEAIELGKQRDAERKRLFARYRDAVLNEDLDTLRNQLAAGMTALPIISWFKCRGPRKRLKLVLIGGKLPGNTQLIEDLDALRKLKTLTAKLADPARPAATAFGPAWRDGEADWDTLTQQIDWAQRYRDHIAQPAVSAIGEPADAQRRAIDLAVNQRERFIEPQSEARRATDALDRAESKLTATLDPLNTLMHTDPDAAWGAPDDSDRLPILHATLDAWRDNTLALRDWCHYRAVREQAVAHHLGPLIQAYETRLIGPQQFDDVLTRSVLTQWHATLSDADPTLGQFASSEHERQLDLFRDLDKRHLQTAGQVVYAKLAQKVPLVISEPSANSEVGILKRQMKLKRRHMPVRKLMQAVPNLLPRLKPCLLMSPLSVAQYLDADYPPFDIVVFDEASQIPVWDAVGAIARGTTCVVVGDSKQLPPTSFFHKLESDDAVPDENDFEELESILDECSAAGLPSMRLLWHYRSRHESLITFSNYHYYNNGLFTFPSPVASSDEMGVMMRHIEDGEYDRGRTCTNPKEAQALVDELVSRLQHYDTDSYQSIGVVTFSMAQQVLIEDLLDVARRDHPEIDVFFGGTVEEPVFVKNLENVQGDERAEIFFSVCYGPDASGKVSMNFGPLNREGGERRLNVAITRARRRVVVFSSLRADQIDLSRTQQVGVKHMRSFLDYAQRGAAAIGEAVTLDRKLRAVMPFEQAIESAVRELGFDVDRHVGASGYRVVLGVRDPEDEGRYLLGIECDGPFYANAPAARDRDRTRPGVMGGLGWRLHRVWSADWWHDPAREAERLREAIEQAQRGEPDKPKAKSSGASQPTKQRHASPRTIPGLTVYKPYVASRPAGTSEDFYDDAKQSRAAKSLMKVIEREGPIHRELLSRRVTARWGIGRLTGKAQRRVDQLLMRRVMAKDAMLHGEFVWDASVPPDSFEGFRVPAEGAEPLRHIEEVAPEELGNAALAVLAQMVALPRAELDRAVADLFGFSRVTSRVQPAVDAAVQRLLDSGRCVIDENGNVALPSAT